MGVFFRIIMPNYNNREWLDKSIGSVKSQTFKDLALVFMDDLSTDSSLGKAVELSTDDSRILPMYCSSKRYNGGARNDALDYYVNAEYTLFLDSDDWLCDENVLQDLHDFIVEKDYPDCVRLPYRCRIGGVEIPVILDDDTPEKLVGSRFVACWTKCVKTELVELFPENTLMEDVAQHIKQCDAISEVVPFTRPAVVCNRNNSMTERL